MLKEKLEHYYSQYNKRDLIHPDPLEFLYQYTRKKDIEIVGIISSALAFGRVAQIIKSVSSVLNIMGNTPSAYLISTPFRSIEKEFNGFVYRFVRDREMISLLFTLKNILSDYASIEDCFASGVSPEDETVLNGLFSFDKELKKRSNGDLGYLFADPSKGSGCKRINLFLRWLVRKDDVDLGLWETIPTSKLIIPVDTHMHKIALKLNLTSRKQPNMKTALEITKGFADVSPNDPVKYDFALTRFGIRNEMSLKNI